MPWRPTANLQSISPTWTPSEGLIPYRIHFHGWHEAHVLYVTPHRHRRCHPSKPDRRAVGEQVRVNVWMSFHDFFFFRCNAQGSCIRQAGSSTFSGSSHCRTGNLFCPAPFHYQFYLSFRHSQPGDHTLWHRPRDGPPSLLPLTFRWISSPNPILVCRRIDRPPGADAHTTKTSIPTQPTAHCDHCRIPDGRTRPLSVPLDRDNQKVPKIPPRRSIISSGT